VLNVPQPNWLESQEFREVLSQVINELLNAKLTEFIIQREKGTHKDFSIREDFEGGRGA